MAKIVFIYDIWYESFSIMQLSSVVKTRGHTSYLYMDNGSTHRLIRYIQKVQPDVVGFSVMTGQHLWALRLSSLIKQKCLQTNPVIIFGGPHPTFVPDIVEHDAVDIVCRGEGEGALLDVMDAIDNGNDFSHIPNLWVKRNGSIIRNNVRPLIRDLDTLPVFDREIFYQYSYFRNNPDKGVLTGRGCPFNCAFCYNQQFRELYPIKTKHIRKKSCHRVIEEILLLKRYKNTKIIKFQDDLFTTDKKWLFTFLTIYKKEIDLPFMCYIRADTEDEETIRRLSEGGCIFVNFGIESGDQRLRNKLLNKKLSNDDIYSIAYLLKKYRISFFTDNMFFIPKTTIYHVWKTVIMNQKIRPDNTIVNVFQPYPGTALYDSLYKEHIIERDFFDSIKNIYSFVYLSNTINKDVEKNIYYFFNVLVKFPFLTPLIKKLIGIKPNPLFYVLFKISIGWDYKERYRLGFARFVREAFHHYKFIG